MENKSLNLLKCSILAAFMLFVTSCAEGYDDSEKFSSSVKNSQLESPNLAEGLIVTRITDNNGLGKLRFRWPVVHGAGGYEFTLYNVDDPSNPVAIGAEKEVIDGCVAERVMAEDTKYEVVILTLGNEAYNNKTALEPSKKAYSTLIPSLATIPSGSDLGTYFAENPLEPLKEGVVEVAYDLEAGGEYTMSADVALKLTTLTLRGDKISHAKIKITGNSSFISDGAGITLKWLDIDMEGYSGKGLITYNVTQDPAAFADNGWVAVKTSTQLSSCKITNLKKPILFDNGKKYALSEFIFKDCIIQQNLSSSEYFINFAAGVVKDLRMVNSTFYNKTQTSNTWIRYGNVQFDKADHRAMPDWTTAGTTIQNCTFWQIAYNKQMFNSNGFNRVANYVSIEKSIFVDTGNGEVTRRFLMGSTNPKSTFNLNTYWNKGATPSEELKYDKTGTHLDSDPMLKDPENADFTVTGAEQLAAQTGDLRWLPGGE